MSLFAACGWSFVRALVIAAISSPIAVWLAGMLSGTRSNRKLGPKVLLIALLVPFLMPELLIGFVYSETTLRLVREFSDPTATMTLPTQPRLPQTMDRPINSADITAECLYSALLLFRFVPVAALVMWLMPSPRLSAEAIHCERLLMRNERDGWRRLRSRLGCFVRGPMMAALPAFAIVFLLVFQEFEIASLMQISRAPVAWTVWLFDNHAGGLMLSLSLQLSIVPVLCELVVVGAVFVALLRSDWHQTESLTKTRRTSGPLKWTAIVFLVAAIVMSVGIPLWRMSSGVAGGFLGLVGQSGMLSAFLSELLISLAFGLAAGLAAYWLTGFLFGRRPRTTLTTLCVIPGLVGSLVLSLVALALFQLPITRSAYDTPVPMLIALTLYLLPRAVLLRVVFFSRQPREPIFVAQTMAESGDGNLRRCGLALLWVMRKQPAFWVVVLLTYWGYWDLTVASVLRPTNLEPFTPGLYNLMHYGRNETLTAMTLLAGVFPAVVLLLAAASRRAWRVIC